MEAEPPKAKKPKDRTDQMSFLEHLEELRWRLIKGLIGVVLGTGIAFYFSDFIINEIILGPAAADFFMYDILRVEAIDLTLQSRRLPGQFFTYWGSMLVVGFILGSPLFIYQLWAFVAPALETREKLKTFLAAFFITLFFLMGIAFGYLVLVPFALQFFNQFQISDFIRNDFDINAYFSSIALWVFACGIIFQIPVVSYALSRAGILNPTVLRKYRKHAIVLCLIMAAFLTPPDPVSQILIAVPLTILYEVSIWISKLANRQRDKSLAKSFGEI